jgi:hypothetical protein
MSILHLWTSATLAFQPALPLHTGYVAARGTARMNIIQNPVEILAYAPIAGFAGSWTLAIFSKDFREAEFLQQGKKMRRMQKEPPKVSSASHVLEPVAGALPSPWDRR